MNSKLFLSLLSTLLLSTRLLCNTVPAMEIQLGGLTPAQRAVLQDKQSVKEQLKAEHPSLKKAKTNPQTEEVKLPKKPPLSTEPIALFDPLLPLAPQERELLKTGMKPAQWEALQQLSAQVLLQQKALNQDLLDDKEETQQALALLWQHAVQRSGSVRYAIEKLSKKDASGKPVKDDGFSRRLLQNLAQLGGVAGTLWTGSPVALLSGNVLSDIVSDPGPKHAKTVSDADMVVLAKAVEGLQQQVIHRYFAYRYAKLRYNLAYDGWVELQQHYKTLTETVKQETESQNPWYQAVASLVDYAEQEQELSKQGSKQASESLALLVGYEGLSELEALQQKQKQDAKAALQTSVLP